MNPDDVCDRYSERPIKIGVRDLGEVVLIEGTAESLEFLAELLRAMATSHDDGFEISPNGAGSYFFAKNAEKGFYIHRLAPNAE